jgi:hypothetical protein
MALSLSSPKIDSTPVTGSKLLLMAITYPFENLPQGRRRVCLVSDAEPRCRTPIADLVWRATARFEPLSPRSPRRDRSVSARDVRVRTAAQRTNRIANVKCLNIRCEDSNYEEARKELLRKKQARQNEARRRRRTRRPSTSWTRCAGTWRPKQRRAPKSEAARSGAARVTEEDCTVEVTEEGELRRVLLHVNRLLESTRQAFTNKNQHEGSVLSAQTPERRSSMAHSVP